ncbi:MAG: hypothetical protein WAL50_18085 [Kineosporiaceae bacterium]
MLDECYRIEAPDTARRALAAMDARLLLGSPAQRPIVPKAAIASRVQVAQTEYTVRQAAYDLRKFRGKNLLTKPGRGRRYQVPVQAAGTIGALLALRDHVIAPILAGVRSPRLGRKPSTWTPVDRDYEILRIDMQTLFDYLGISNIAPVA